MSIQVNDFRWEPGKNDAECIKLLESSRNEWQKIAQKAIAKLKTLSRAQEPRVMTLEEVLTLDNDTPIYIQQNMSRGSGWDIYHRGIENHITHDVITGAKWSEGKCWDSRTYGKRWRCWTSRPTDEQRETTPWN